MYKLFLIDCSLLGWMWVTSWSEVLLLNTLFACPRFIKRSYELIPLNWNSEAKRVNEPIGGAFCVCSESTKGKKTIQRLKIEK